MSSYPEDVSLLYHDSSLIPKLMHLGLDGQCLARRGQLSFAAIHLGLLVRHGRPCLQLRVQEGVPV